MTQMFPSLILPPFVELKQLYDKWTWQELQWGMQQKIVSEEDAISFASARLDESSPLFELLLDLATEDKYSEHIAQKVDLLCQAEPPESNKQIQYVWRNVLLLWLFHSAPNNEVLEDAIGFLFVDFSYPEDMACLIGWMPASPGEVCSSPWNIRVQLDNYLKNCPLFQNQSP